LSEKLERHWLINWKIQEEIAQVLCKDEPVEAYSLLFVIDWSHVTCPECLEKKPEVVDAT